MFNKTHIFKNPAGTFSLAGAVPAHPRTLRFVRKGDPRYGECIMAQRYLTRNGRTYGWRSRSFKSREQAERAVRLAGGILLAQEESCPAS